MEVPLGTNVELKTKNKLTNYDIIFHNTNNVTDTFKKNNGYTFKASQTLNYRESYIKTHSFSDQSILMVHVSEPGTLIDLLGIDNVKTLSSLKVSGNLNGTDILTIRKMENLRCLDMEDANIINGGLSYYESYTLVSTKN